jgi:hypothetical protein
MQDWVAVSAIFGLIAFVAIKKGWDIYLEVGKDGGKFRAQKPKDKDKFA